MEALEEDAALRAVALVAVELLLRAVSLPAGVLAPPPPPPPPLPRVEEEDATCQRCALTCSSHTTVPRGC